MKIAFLHYHLKTGGVTTVLRQQIDAIKDHCQALILSGEPLTGEINAPVAHIPGLAYDRLLTADTSPGTTAEAILHAMKKTFGSVCDILHVHNPLLSKNHYLLKVLHLLQEQNIPLLLQIHDFAEDGRPHVYYGDQEYPKNCHYAVINSRDYQILRASGGHKNGIHMLENMVNPLPMSLMTVPQFDSILYPVRAIRRKNIGEAILLSLLSRTNNTLMITQPPNSPEDIQSHSDWKQFVANHQLQVVFEAGVEKDFSELVTGARFLITTSISEGFGFSFLEPWTANKYLHGRQLPSICADFTDHDVSLEHLYSALRVPATWVDFDAFQKKWMDCMSFALKQFFVSNDFIDLNALFQQLIFNDTIDFGILDEPFQRTVLEKLIFDPNAKKVITTLNPQLDVLNKNLNKEVIEKNKKAVAAHYHPDGYASKLLDIYAKTKIPVHHAINKSELLRQFLRPENLSLLKWGRYAT